MIKRIVYIMSDSVSNWFKYFCSPEILSETVMLNSISYDEIDNEVTRVQKKYGKAVEIYIISSHSSFKLDLFLAKLYKEKGFLVFVQSREAIDYGLNKIKQKMMLDKNQYPIPDWTTNYKEAKDDYLVKANDTTEGKGIRWNHKRLKNAEADTFYEKFIYAYEYSVNVFFSDSVSFVFPAVYKGRNSKDLNHPSKRIRLCGQYEKEIQKYEKSMQLQALELAKRINNWGFMEVEFLVTDSGSILVLEINPRISGTLRMATLAIKTKCFDLLFGKTNFGQNVLCNVYEFPNSGEMFFDCKNQVYCTSRATIVADSDFDLERKMKIFDMDTISIDDIKEKRKGVLFGFYGNG